MRLVYDSMLIRTLKTDLIVECHRGGEFTSLSIDGTMKICMKLLGQRKFNVAVEHSHLPAMQDVHRILTVRGMSAATLAVHPSPDESAVNISHMLSEHFTAPQLAQVLCVSHSSYAR